MNGGKRKTIPSSRRHGSELGGPMPEWADYQHANCCPCHTTRKIAYSLDEAAARVGCSTALLRAQIAHGYLLARYVNSKPLIAHEELVEWLNNLPTEPR